MPSTFSWLDHSDNDRRRVLDAIDKFKEADTRDLTESGLVFRSGAGKQSVYRAASEAELAELSRFSSEQGLDEWLWVVVYRQGPLSELELAQSVACPAPALSAALARLVAEGRVQHLADGRLGAQDFVVPLGSARGWEAAVFDHLKSVVQTICQRLQLLEAGSTDDGKVGGSTYGFDVWPGHPCEQEVMDLLRTSRRQLGELRSRVDAYNRRVGLPPEFSEVVSYVGQCVFEREGDASADQYEHE
jgi:hypothetical protein